MRGLFTAGILDVLYENGIVFDGMVGVLAGAAFGVNYKSRQPGRVLRYNMKYAKNWRYCSLWSLFTTGNLYGAEFGFHLLPEKLDVFDNEAYEQNPMQFHLVATDVETGKPVYRRIDQGGSGLYDWILASASMPLVSRVVSIDDMKLLDGGITDSIPLEYFQRQGFERNVVILTQPSTYQKSPMKAMSLIRRMMHRYPALVDAWEHRHEMYNRQLLYVAEETKKGNTLVLCPEETLPIGRVSHNREKMQQTYHIGRSMALRRLEEIKAFLTH